MNDLLTKHYTASGAVAQYQLVKLAGTGLVAAAAAATDRAIGVAIHDAASGEGVDVQHAGIVDVLFGGTVAQGKPVCADSAGDAVAQTATGLKRFLLSGGSAGNLTVTGIATTDRLVAVLSEDATSGVTVDLTAEFSITATNTINNTGGTATTGKTVIVLYERDAPRLGYALQAAVDGDIGPVLISLS
jgi:hypothetical protein